VRNRYSAIRNPMVLRRTADFRLAFLQSGLGVARQLRTSRSLVDERLRGRRPFGDPMAYSQKSGNAMVESQYATTVSGSTPDDLPSSPLRGRGAGQPPRRPSRS